MKSARYSVCAVVGAVTLLVLPQGLASDGDLTVCELADVRQATWFGSGEENGVVALSMETRFLNYPGTGDIIWRGIYKDVADGNEKHPFIVLSLYRLENDASGEYDRLKQIGLSWAKHGQFASHSPGFCENLCAPDPQCNCEYEIPEHDNHDWTGAGCVDIYNAYTNANQPYLGPRHEINPWTGYWDFDTSHTNPLNGHSHGQLDHRLNARADDLSNAEAQYFAGAYIVVAEDYDDGDPNNIGDDDGDGDMDHMNNAGWIEIEPIAPTPPDTTWTFAYPTGSTASEIAINIWPNAQQSIIAAQLPVVEGESADGRCVLAAKDTYLGSSVWHYEYALMNVDMNDKVKSFSVPIPPGTTVTNAGFFAAEHERPDCCETVPPPAGCDVCYSNDAWTVTVGSNEITWSTTDNPLEWGSMFNFWFDANVVPCQSTVSFGLYESGTTAYGITKAPDLNCPPENCSDGIDNNCNLLVDCADTDFCDIDSDGDGFGAPPCGNDCDDNDPLTHPGALERCIGGVDNDCDGYVDCDDPDCIVDADGDGYITAHDPSDFSRPWCGDDCFDFNDAIHPGAVEICNDSIDNDCDGNVDCNDTQCPGPDDDGDGYDSIACGGTDCDDSNAAVHPGATELCSDQIDNDCDGSVNEGCGSGCFPAGTRIAMADGTTKSIEAVRIGDRVMSYDTSAKRVVPGVVRQTFVHPPSDRLVVINDALRATPNHEIFAGGAWMRADALDCGAELVRLDQAWPGPSTTQSDSVGAIAFTNGAGPVYNIEVSGQHNYFAEGVLVHNKPPKIKAVDPEP